MWRPAALVGPQYDGNLRDARPDLPSFDNHLQREFHSGASNIQPVIESAREPTHTAVAIADTYAKKKIQHRRQARIPEIPVQRRHCTGFDSAAEAIAHHHFVAL